MKGSNKAKEASDLEPNMHRTSHGPTPHIRTTPSMAFATPPPLSQPNMAIGSLSASPAPAMSLSRRSRRHDYYQLLDQQVQHHQGEVQEPHRSSFHRKSPFKLASNKSNRGGGGDALTGGHYYSYSYHKYRMERAKKRQIFLKGYNLSFDGKRQHTAKGRLKKSFVKVKTAVLTIVAFARLNIFSSCRRSRGVALPSHFFSPAPAATVQVSPVAAH